MQAMKEVLEKAVQFGASDIFCVAGMPPCVKVAGKFLCLTKEDMSPSDTVDCVNQLYGLGVGSESNAMKVKDEDDFSFAIPGLARFRANVYKQRNSLAAVVRVVPFDLPSVVAMRIPENVMQLAELRDGLVLVTGPAGSGKSTTLACLIDAINSTRQANIVTLEDPIEYLHRHKKSIVTQREIGVDTESFSTALRSVLRQAPDVILLGEMRDLETMQTAITAAETGHLVISTLHTLGASNAIGRIVDAFPTNQQQQIQLQLSMVLRAVVSQRLLPRADGGVVPAFEVMRVNTAVANMIRDSKLYQLESVIASSSSSGMSSLDANLLELVKSGEVSKDDAVLYALNPERVKRQLL